MFPFQLHPNDVESFNMVWSGEHHWAVKDCRAIITTFGSPHGASVRTSSDLSPIGLTFLNTGAIPMATREAWYRC